MKNKILFLLISISAIVLIVSLGIKLNTNDNSKKIKADITYPTSNGFAISCVKNNLTINELTTCTLSGHFENGISGLYGLLNISSGIDIVSITPDSNFEDANLLIPEESRNPLLISYLGLINTNDYIVAEIRIKATEIGSNTIKFENDEEYNNKIIVSDKNDNVVELNGASVNINVIDGDSTDDSTLSSIKTLENLHVDKGELSPSFDRTVYSYSAIVPNNVTQISISGEKTDPNSVVTGFKKYDLVEGENVIEVEITAENGTKSTYVILVTRESEIDSTKSSDNDLKSLTVDNVTLTPNFSNTITQYMATVDNNVTSVIVHATSNDANATVAVIGNENLKEGNNTITIKITAEDNSIKTYTIVVTRKKSNDTSCKLELSSSVYKIDNTKLLIDLVDKEHSVDIIRKNLSLSCGTMSITNDKVIISDDVNVKSYTINRIFVPKTGQNYIDYLIVISFISMMIGILVAIKSINKA